MSAAGVLLILTTVSATLGVVFWLLGFAIGRGRRTGWVATTGQWQPFRGAVTRSWCVVYTDGDGRTHRVFPLMNQTSLAPQGPVPVSHDPDRPARAVIDTFYHRGGVLKVVGGVLLGLAIALALGAVGLATLS